MRILYFDCFSGAAGDMILGALVDAGVPFPAVREALGSLAIEPDTVWTERVTRAGVAATKFHVRGEDDTRHDTRGHHHHHEHHHHAHRSLAEIDKLIDRSALSPAAQGRAKALFETLGRAEAAIHGTTLDEVHLHEVGALDSIIDIVAAVFAFETLGVDKICASALNVGSGTVVSAHGRYPVPAPATLRLLEGVPMYSGVERAELVTPTGALLMRHYVSEFGPMPPMRMQTVGYGAGSRDFADSPNVLRAVIGEEASATTSHGVVVIETEIDDMNPQIFGVLMDQLLAQGALDVFYTPIQMKKSRPGTLLSVVAPSDHRERLTATIFRESTTIGVRYREMARECLDRQTIPVETPFGSIRMKVARRSGEVMNASPEFDDCVRIANQCGVPLKDVQAAAAKAFLEVSPRPS